MRFCAALLSFVFVIGPISGAPEDVVAAQDAQKKSEEAQRVDEATAILTSVLSDDGKTIPRDILENAVAIAVLPYRRQPTSLRGQGPATRRANFMGSIRARGIMSVRDDSGAWQAPAFVSLNGGDRQAADLLLVVMKRSTVDRVLGNAFKFESNAAAGPVGTDAKGATDPQAQPEIFTYTRSRRGFSGITLNATMFLHDNDSTARFYGKPLTGVKAAAQKSGPDPVRAWLSALEKHAGK
jgi:SH3 domain-containing YSC84-like protein 1